MRISTCFLSAVLALACGLAQAQAYRWVDKDGKVRYGDFPPAGVKATPMKAPAAGAAPSAPAAASAPAAKDGAAKAGAAKDAKKGPMTAAEQEKDYRERQAKAKEAQAKSDKDQALADQMRQNCNAAQESLRSLQAGTRISSINAQGETVVLDDSQRAARVEQAKKAVAENCK